MKTQWKIERYNKNKLRGGRVEWHETSSPTKAAIALYWDIEYGFVVVLYKVGLSPTSFDRYRTLTEARIRVRELKDTL